MKSEKMKAYFENYCSTSAKHLLPAVYFFCNYF